MRAPVLSNTSRPLCASLNSSIQLGVNRFTVTMLVLGVGSLTVSFVLSQDEVRTSLLFDFRKTSESIAEL
jgi:hypothetical protein